MFLYETFEKAWKKPGGNIYLISDNHFADEEMKYIRANYIGDSEQIKRINSKVSKNDTFICLGDCGCIEYFKQLKAGYKVLIMGNHDRGASNYKRALEPVYHNGFTKETYKAYIEAKCKKHYKEIFGRDYDSLTEEEKAEAYHTFYCFDNHYKQNITLEDNRLFDEVYEGPLMINDRIILSHEPIPVPDYMFNIHGHAHSKIKADGHHLNVCAEHIDYTPISLLSFIKKGGLSKIPNIHRVTIDDATERKEKRKLKNNKQ